MLVGGDYFPCEEADLDWFNVELELVLAEFLAVEQVLDHIEQDLARVLSVENELHLFLGQRVNVGLDDFKRPQHCI